MTNEKETFTRNIEALLVAEVYELTGDLLFQLYPATFKGIFDKDKASLEVVVSVEITNDEFRSMKVKAIELAIANQRDRLTKKATEYEELKYNVEETIENLESFLPYLP